MSRAVFPGLVILLTCCCPSAAQAPATLVIAAPPAEPPSAAPSVEPPRAEVPKPKPRRAPGVWDWDVARLPPLDFENYRDRRLDAIRNAFASDPAINAGWRAHAVEVERFARAPRAAAMESWRALVASGQAENQHEGISLNVALTGEDVDEILANAPKVKNRYWIVEHLKRHPNRPDRAPYPIPWDREP